MKAPARTAQFPWLAVSIGATVTIAVSAALIGLIWLPLAQPGLKLTGVWDAICSAAGVPRNAAVEPTLPAAFKTSEVVVIPGMLASSTAPSIGRGATLAQRCAICHGIRGEGGGAVPNLAGQYAAAIDKELDDFSSGARANAVMTPFAAGLSDGDRHDLAAYYSDLPQASPKRLADAPAVPSIVLNGAPMRNVAPCLACHGGMGLKTGAPRLMGQAPAYIRAQLQAFATGARHNDISMQMRNVARGLESQEIEAAVRFYQGSP